MRRPAGSADTGGQPDGRRRCEAVDPLAAGIAEDHTRAQKADACDDALHDAAGGGHILGVGRILAGENDQRGAERHDAHGPHAGGLPRRSRSKPIAPPMNVAAVKRRIASVHSSMMPVTQTHCGRFCKSPGAAFTLFSPVSAAICLAALSFTREPFVIERHDRQAAERTAATKASPGLRSL